MTLQQGAGEKGASEPELHLCVVEAVLCNGIFQALASSKDAVPGEPPQ